MPGEKRFPVIEIFGPTIQGEGIMAGKPTYFIRFGGCDYRCAWCDSGYAVLPNLVRENSTKLTAEEMIDELTQLEGDPEWVTLSGGNPALHQLGPLVDTLHDAGLKVAVETQGSLWKDWFLNVDQLTVSPKPPSSQMDVKTDYLTLSSIIARTDPILKVPVQDNEDYEWAVALHQRFPEVPFYFSVVTLMGGLDGRYAEGRIDTLDDLVGRTRWLYERLAVDPRCRDTTAFPQLHALVWGHGRGF